MLPPEHRLHVVGLKQAVALETLEDASAKEFLEPVHRSLVEGLGGVEARRPGGAALGGAASGLLQGEHPVDHAAMVVEMGVEGAAEALNERHRPGSRRDRGAWPIFAP